MVETMMWVAMQDILQVLIVVISVSAGWSVHTSAWTFLFGRFSHPKVKTVVYDDECYENDCKASADFSEDAEEDSTTANDNSEVSVTDDDLPEGLLLLEQYGVFGASPGSWTRLVKCQA
eukprot:TRINITY_DN64188_c0_g1_i1.p1 TRINITY_DN64188_c0_g1~~TRINITY_DN64188_c0_g1_i1.p1  ORF type:complete len:119 (-),score=24.15 TRINITY_DN64188_c0_g1_i1:582-938(-)